MLYLARAILVIYFASCMLVVKSEFLVGTGIYDVTGPAADINMMGYAAPKQHTGGISLRLRSRAFVFVDPKTGNRVAFVSIDSCMGSDIITKRVVEMLENEPSTKGFYSYENVCISGTHTHSGPAGFLQYVLFQITSLGFVHESADTIARGISLSIIMAHERVKPANILINTGNLKNANINRSPTSYLLNPAQERRKYAQDTDTLMTLLKIVDAKDSANELGMLNWFAVHGTSMNNSNTLISGDNKGYASWRFEKLKNPEGTLPGLGQYVAAFAQSNLGDVSPNTNGPHCINSGKPCDVLHSTCEGKNELCIASGPGKDMFESTQIIGDKQFHFAKELYDSAHVKLKPSGVGFIHRFVDMSNLTVLNPTLGEGPVKLCKAAMGYSFAAGTTDGPGMFNFEQGFNKSSGNPFWNMIRDFIKKPSAELEACQHPKPVLFATGEATLPYAWDPHVLPLQILRIGNLYIVAVPTELTTMAGRRLRTAVRRSLRSENVSGKDIHVVIAGLANSYASYCTTPEEFIGQRYEAASTLYGPNTLDGYLQEFRVLARALRDGETVSSVDPPEEIQHQISLNPGVWLDSGNPGKVDIDAHASYVVGDIVDVTFESACPRNNQMLQDTFLLVEKFDTLSNAWRTVATDGDWETRFHWYRHLTISGYSYAHIMWNTTAALPGQYRVTHQGYWKSLIHRTPRFFQGSSRSFEVTAPSSTI